MNQKKNYCKQQKRNRFTRFATALEQLVQEQTLDVAYLDNGNGSVTFYPFQ